MDNNIEQYFQATANWMLEVQSTEVMFDELLEPTRSNLKMHHEPLITTFPIVVEDALQYLFQRTLIRRKGIQSNKLTEKRELIEIPRLKTQFLENNLR